MTSGTPELGPDAPELGPDAVADLAGDLGHGLVMDVDFGITLTDRVSVLVEEGRATGLLEGVLQGGLILGLVSDLAIGRFPGGCGNVEPGRFLPLAHRSQQRHGGGG